MKRVNPVNWLAVATTDDERREDLALLVEYGDRFLMARGTMITECWEELEKYKRKILDRFNELRARVVELESELDRVKDLKGE